MIPIGATSELSTGLKVVPQNVRKKSVARWQPQWPKKKMKTVDLTSKNAKDVQVKLVPDGIKNPWDFSVYRIQDVPMINKMNHLIDEKVIKLRWPTRYPC